MGKGLKRVLILGGAALALVAGAAAAVALSPAIQDRVFAYGVRNQLQVGSRLPLDTNGLRVLLCGTSGPMPQPASAKACNVVVAGGRLFVVDMGPEASKNLALWRVPTSRLSAVFITHFHSDHIGELGELNVQSWAQGRRAPLPVYGPEGIADVVDGFNKAYAPDHMYRHAHHDRGRGLLPLAASLLVARPFTLPAAASAGGVRSTVIYDEGGVRVTAVETDHRPVVPAVSYRFDYGGRSVLITGDTVYYRPLAIAGKGVDVLVSEAQSYAMQDIVAAQAEAVGQTTLGRVLRDTRDYHISPVDAARLANEMGARELVFTHMAPPIRNRLMKRMWLRGVSAVRPEGVTVGRDGLLVTVPLDKGPITFEDLAR